MPLLAECVANSHCGRTVSRGVLGMFVKLSVQLYVMKNRVSEKGYQLRRSKMNGHDHLSACARTMIMDKARKEDLVLGHDGEMGS